jgi:hypothetical protein
MRGHDDEPMAKVSDARGLALLEELIEELPRHNWVTWDQTLWLDVENTQRGWRTPVTALPEPVRETLVPTWHCGTVACLFGHAVFKAGAKFHVYEGNQGVNPFVSTFSVDDPSGERRDIFGWAEELFGLDEDQTDWLSAGEREWSEIVAFRDAWREDAAAGPDVDSARRALVDREH